ncbi:transposase [Virgibacillus litoralis]|uniref:Transposase n=1 Tax=Virgibacillus litoralis TaxID=578221 RepID=A0ABS4HHD0_9BACI|nr:transposase [Virgibacillus litoralis]MBP1950337.1 transposase [Virgibacillus litoralis]
MGEHRQRYSEKFKKKAVEFAQEQRQKKTITDIADELQIPLSSLHEWMKHYREFENEPVTVDRVKQLEQQLEEKEHELKMKDKKLTESEEELAILKKAEHFFSKQKP